ncbi:MBL fold metallo-hydrolase [Polycyclovorans algicola]|uniref:MBL fold metallo-hydrolase n=1 Tax=Polycyclovorans algicola TaxID=616992 RepID=UPI0005BC8A63|nr:MBL fold metallo-hydrolase [Polycyclovorans algicola]
MALRFASLGSGSKGNATVVEGGGTRVLIDCGFGLRETAARLARLDLLPQQIDAILVTHEHGDHAGGVAPLARRWNIPVHLTHGTARSHRAFAGMALHCFDADVDFEIGALRIRAFSVPHDAAQPCQYRVECCGVGLGVVSDLGHVSANVVHALQGVDALALECNHDPQLLAAGPYPPSLKARVGGDWGHLANAQAAQLLARLDLTRLQHLWLTHLSEVNNSPAHALDAVAPALADHALQAHCANQSQGFDWCEVVA